jgi:hypothetical protein
MIDRVRWGALLCAAVLVVGAVGGVPVATASTDTGVDSGDDENEAPLADAGLDQEVPINATVFLDASGSRDPDGSIASYEWAIERPDGTPTSPRCDTCAQSEFQVGMAGTYAVTVTVTDDDGATSTDTLYVEVSDVEGPSVALSGPTSVTPGTNVTFDASATAGEEPLLRIDWAINGSEIADQDVRGESATDEIERSFEPGIYQLSVEVLSELGRTDTATMVVEVTANASGRTTQPCPAATWNQSRDDWDTSGCDSSNSSNFIGDLGNDDDDIESICSDYGRDDDFYCNNDRLMYGNAENIIIHDADNDGEVTVFGKTLDPEDSKSGMGKSYRMTRAEYREKFGVKTVRLLESQAARSAADEESNQDTTFDGSGNTDEDQSEGGDGDGCENVPRRYRTRC